MNIIEVFYTAGSWDNPQMQKMYFEALNWAMGLSEGEVKPLAGK